jgi:hypothetical protein
MGEKYKVHIIQNRVRGKAREKHLGHFDEWGAVFCLQPLFYVAIVGMVL